MDSIRTTRYTTGKRQYTTYLYDHDRFPQDLIAPATFLWRQEGTTSSSMEVDELSSEGQLWIWIHPSAFEIAKEKIEEAAVKSKLQEKIHLVDLENSLVMFDFTGPRSTALLQAVLQTCKPEVSEAYQEAHKVITSSAKDPTETMIPCRIEADLIQIT